MSMFSSTDKNKNVLETIPPEIRQAVSVMGDTRHPESAGPKAPAGNSPFLDGGTSAPSVTPPAPTLKPLFDQPIKPASEKRSRLLWIGAGIALLLVSAGAVYGYVSSRNTALPAEPAVEIKATLEVMTPPPAPQPAQAPPFSLIGPNYLSLDTETVTPESFRALLKEKGAIIQNAGIVQPVEFLLTDKNNNPVAFSRVAYLMNIDLSQPFLASLAESFSLYLYNDQGAMRLGLALSFGTVDGPTLFAKEREGAFPYAFRSFLYQGMTVPREVSFRSGAYRDQAVRFVNIDETTQTSFDYALRGTTWLIGTSKETLRALLDAN